jgi:uncharacterized repeat protein (TIGR01451 family)
LLERLEDRTTPSTVNLSPVADNTLFQASTADPSQQLSDGAGQHFYVGDTIQGSNAIRRGAIRFDLSSIPAGSTITSVTLKLNMSMTISGADNIILHQALMSWGEGSSNAALAGKGSEGIGIQATTNDVTWFYTFFPTQKWTTPGGDFVAAPSASTSVNGAGSYQWTGPGLIADVQQWVNNAATNFGWILTGNETSAPTAKQFDTQANANAANRPMLTVTFNPPAGTNLAIVLSHVGDFHQGDAADTYMVTVSNPGPGPTAGAVTVTDTLPTGLAPTAADNGTMNGWSISTSGQTITATRSDPLAGGSSYPALVLTVSVAGNAPASITSTVSVSGGGAANAASASDPTTIIQGADLTISKSHTGNFKQGDSADTYSLTVSNIGSGATTGMVSVMDMLPAGLTPTAADNGVINGWTISANGQTITATRDDELAGNSSYTVLTISVSVDANAPTSVVNTATVAGGSEGNTTNDTASDLTTIIQNAPVAVLNISKSHSGNFHPGDRADVYLITITNFSAAPTDGSPVTVTDMLPTGLVPTPADDGILNGWSLSTSGQSVTATRNDVLAGGSSYPVLTLTVSVADNAPPSLTNTATVSGGGGVNTANTASDVTSITAVADLMIALSHTGSLNAGGAATYTITVGNTGGAASNGEVMVIDLLPAGLTYTGPATANGWTITTNGRTLTATRLDALAGGASFQAVPLTVSVAANAPTTFINTATVSGGGELNISNDAVADVAGGQSPHRRGDTTSGSPALSTSAVLDNVANALTHSDEFFTNLLTQDYMQLLHRTPSAAEVASWVSQLKSGLSEEQMLAGFTSSPEYYLQAGGTDQGWLDALYHDVLGRSADAAGEANWLQALASGASRFNVALAVATSLEHESILIAADYQRYLSRSASAAEVASWVNSLQHGLSDEQVAAAFVASDEFFSGHGSSTPGWLDGAYQVVLQRDPDPVGFSSWYADLEDQLAGD